MDLLIDFGYGKSAEEVDDYRGGVNIRVLDKSQGLLSGI
jgi:hypothetical protein